MTHLRVALSFFARTRLRHWPGLAFYLAGWLTYRLFGVRLFKERRLRLGDLVVNADAEGQSGLVFLHEIMARRIYDFPALREAHDIRVAFDAGANCGFYTLTAALHWPGLRAFCFEPHPVTFGRLKQNIRCNHLENRVTPVHAAVAANSGRCSLALSENSSMGVVATSPMATNDRVVEVPMVSLDDYAKAHSQYPDLMKIDVEGFEVEVLKGASECLAKSRYVILEVHSDELARDSLELLHRANFQTSRQGPLIFAAK